VTVVSDSSIVDLSVHSSHRWAWKRRLLACQSQAASGGSSAFHKNMNSNYHRNRGFAAEEMDHLNSTSLGVGGGGVQLVKREGTISNFLYKYIFVVCVYFF